MIPQIIYICLLIFTLTVHLIKHDEPREGNYNFWHMVIAGSITVTILYYGGFWNPILPLLN